MKALVLLFITGALLSLSALTAICLRWQPVIPDDFFLQIENLPEPVVMFWVGLSLMGLSGLLGRLKK